MFFIGVLVSKSRLSPETASVTNISFSIQLTATRAELDQIVIEKTELEGALTSNQKELESARTEVSRLVPFEVRTFPQIWCLLQTAAVTY